MKDNKHIEKGRGPLLNSLEKRNCFKVPQGYFALLHQAVGLRVQIGDKPFEDVLKGLKEQQSFALPTDYFDSLAQRIAQQTQPVELPKKEGFAVPQGYFDVLYSAIINRVAAPTTSTNRWQGAGVLRPALALAAVVAIAAVITWPVLTDTEKTGKALHAGNIYKFKTEENAIGNNKITDKTVAVATENFGSAVAIKPNKKAVAVNVLQTAKAADLVEYNDGYGTENLLEKLPVAENTQDSHLFEIMAEEDIDLADLMESLN